MSRVFTGCQLHAKLAVGDMGYPGLVEHPWARWSWQEPWQQLASQQDVLCDAMQILGLKPEAAIERQLRQEDGQAKQWSKQEQGEVVVGTPLSAWFPSKQPPKTQKHSQGWTTTQGTIRDNPCANNYRVNFREMLNSWAICSICPLTIHVRMREPNKNVTIREPSVKSKGESVTHPRIRGGVRGDAAEKASGLYVYTYVYICIHTYLQVHVYIMYLSLYIYIYMYIYVRT